MIKGIVLAIALFAAVDLGLNRGHMVASFIVTTAEYGAATMHIIKGSIFRR